MRRQLGNLHVHYDDVLALLGFCRRRLVTPQEIGFTFLGLITFVPGVHRARLGTPAVAHAAIFSHTAAQASTTATLRGVHGEGTRATAGTASHNSETRTRQFGHLQARWRGYVAAASSWGRTHCLWHDVSQTRMHNTCHLDVYLSAMHCAKPFARHEWCCCFSSTSTLLTRVQCAKCGGFREGATSSCHGVHCRTKSLTKLISAWAPCSRAGRGKGFSFPAVKLRSRSLRRACHEGLS